MEYESIFSFFKEKKGFEDIFKLCIQFEKSIVNQCFNSALMTGRVISEMLLIKLGLKDNHIRKKVLIKKDSNWEIRREYSLETLIKRCYNSDEALFNYEVKEKYFKIKNLGNSNSHSVKVNKYGLKHCKEMHELIYDVSADYFNQFFDIDLVDYEFNLDNININKRFTSDEVFSYLNNIHENEINTSSFIEYIDEKKIFFTSSYFDEIIHEYRGDILDKGDFEAKLDKCRWVDDSNFKIFLEYFDNSIRKELFSKFARISQENLVKIIEILNNQSDYITINDIDVMLINGDKSNKLYYEHLKKLSDSFFSDYLDEIVNELKNVLVKEKDGDSEEIINKLKNYKTVYDDYGFTIKQVDENIFLDDDQRDAVRYDGNKPLVINAGPGSGKTRVIVERVRFLINESECDIDPDSILVITFTNEATNEIKNRLKYETDLGINVVNQMKISTIHGFCRYLIAKHEDDPYTYLSRHGERNLFIKKYKKDLGFYGPYNIFGRDLPTILGKYDHYFSFGIKCEEFANYIAEKDKVTDDYLDFVENFANETNGKFPTFNQLHAAKLTAPHYYAKYLQIPKSYPEYKRLLKENRACDDNYLLEKGYEILCNYGTDYTCILIDEFQDTDYHLKKIVDKLKEHSKKFTIVGDLDQSIYGFRGAIPEYFKEFVDNKEENKVIELQTNYRSTRDIVEFTEEFIKDKREDDKKLIPKKQYGAPVYHLSNHEESEEFRDLIFIIKNLKKYKKVKYYSDILVLFKSHKKINDFVEELELFDIPYYIDNKKDFLNQNEIKAILTLYWYLLDYDEYNLQYNKKLYEEGNNFLCFYGFTDRIYDSSDFFKLSEETRDVLNKIQENYEKDIIDKANNLYEDLHNHSHKFKYDEVFDQDLIFVKSVVDSIEKVNLIELDDIGLIKLGITNKKDIDFFLKLKNLKLQMINENYKERPTTLKLFKEFITMTNFYSEISLKNSDEAIKINKDISLLSNIIKDYENIMGNKNYYGLFNYLNGVLSAYSSSSNEFEEEMDKVHVRTIHNSKGLEYPVVIIGSLGRLHEKNSYYSFPSISNNVYNEDKKTIDHYPFETPIRFLKRPPIDFIKFHNDEEFRKIYVGTTRAKEILILSTIGEIPGFIKKIKNSDVNFESINPGNIINIKKIESSKIINKRNLVPELNFENIVKDYLFCQFRYNLSNNIKLELDRSDSNYIDMLVHNLLGNIHSHHIEKTISEVEVTEKINDFINLHPISSNDESILFISNIIRYWKETGSNFKILNNNISLAFSFENCELNGVVDLIIQGSVQNKISLVKFICTDKRMDNESLDYYQMIYHFYSLCLKQYDDFKDKQVESIIVYSLNNNKVHEFDYNEKYENMAIEFLETITAEIIDSKFEKNNNDSCDTCEYRSEFCKN